MLFNQVDIHSPISDFFIHQCKYNCNENGFKEELIIVVIPRKLSSLSLEFRGISINKISFLLAI